MPLLFMLTSRSDLSPVLSNPSLTCFKSFSSPHPASYPPVQLLPYTYKASCKRSNIVGQQLPTLLNIACCVRLHVAFKYRHDHTVLTWSSLYRFLHKLYFSKANLTTYTRLWLTSAVHKENLH